MDGPVSQDDRGRVGALQTIGQLRGQDLDAQAIACTDRSNTWKDIDPLHPRRRRRSARSSTDGGTSPGPRAESASAAVGTKAANAVSGRSANVADEVPVVDTRPIAVNGLTGRHLGAGWHEPEHRAFNATAARVLCTHALASHSAPSLRERALLRGAELLDAAAQRRRMQDVDRDTGGYGVREACLPTRRSPTRETQSTSCLAAVGPSAASTRMPLLAWVSRNYVRGETIAAANELQLKVHARIPLVAALRDGHARRSTRCASAFRSALKR